MITKFRVENFQSFADVAEMELKKLNFIYGANSNGKSALFRALRLISSNIAPNFENSDAIWDFNSSGLKLQSFDNTVHKNNSRKLISLGVDFEVSVTSDTSPVAKGIKDLQDELNSLRHSLQTITELPEPRKLLARQVADLQGKLEDLKSRSRFNLPLHIDLKLASPGRIVEIVFGINEYVPLGETEAIPAVNLSFTRKFVAGSWEWDFSDPALKYGEIGVIQKHLDFLDSASAGSVSPFDSLFEQNGIGASSKKKTKSTWKSEYQEEALRTAYVVFGSPGGIEISGGDSYPAPEQLSPIYKTVERFLDSMWRSFYREIRGLETVGPIREIPQLVLEKDSWFHALKNESTHKVGNSNRRFKAAKKAFSDLTEGQYDFEFSELQVNDQPTGYWALQVINSEYKTNLQNVGVGISQVLPVVFALFGANKRQLLSRLTLIEQPELHLHPKLQSDLADVMISALEEMPNRQVLVETHSENLLLRILRRIREADGLSNPAKRKINSSDVSLVFVEKQAQGAVVSQMTISKHGEVLSNWPVDFVDIRLDDVL